MVVCLPAKSLTKFLITMNFNVNRAMKKILTMICVAAAALVGCQNVDDINEGALNGKSIKATASTPKLTRTELVYADDAYKAQWCAGDKVALVEIATIDAENVEITKYESNALADAAESAVFSFNEVSAVAAASYQYVLAYPYGKVGGANATTVNLTLATAQEKKDTSYGANCDLLIAKSDVLAEQPEGLAFTLTRLSAVAKMTLKNFVIPAGEVIEDVTLSCEHTLTGTVGVSLEDLSLSVVSGANSVTTTNYEWTVAADGTLDVYFSVLPATLAAGESYTITVETDKANYHKVANFVSDLKFQAGDITIFSANMRGMASKSKVENLNENCEYAIGYTDASGNVWLLPRDARTRRLSAHKVGVVGTGYNGESYDLTSVSIDANGVLVGNVADTYRWKSAKTQEGNLQFYYITGSEKVAYLIGCNETQGIAVLSKNDKGIYAGQYHTTQTYYDYFIPSSVDGGYWMQVPNSSRYLCYNSDTNQFRALGSNVVDGVLNFYRIQSFKENTYPAVVTNSAEVTDGTYVFLAKKADGSYYALPNDKSAFPGENRPISYLLSEETVGLTMNSDGTVASAANVKDQFKWVIKRNSTSAGWNIISAVNMENYLWMRNANTGITVGTEEEAKTISDSSKNFSCDWYFSEDATKGMQAQTPIAITHNFRVYVDPAAGRWRCKNSVVDTIVLVKLSNSTEQIATE